MKRLLSLAIILLTSLNVLAQQKTVNIVTVNNPDMITLKKLSTKFEAGQSEHQIELAGAGGEHHAPADHHRRVHRGRAI